MDVVVIFLNKKKKVLGCLPFCLDTMYIKGDHLDCYPAIDALSVIHIETER